MAETETDDAERATQLLVRFKADLAALYISPAYAESVHVVITGLLDVAEGLARRSVRFEPAAAPVLLRQMTGMVERVAAVATSSTPAAPAAPAPGTTWH